MGLFVRGKTIWYRFNYKERQVRESTGLENTKENIEEARFDFKRLKRQLREDTFDYLKWFPDSPNLEKLGIQKEVPEEEVPRIKFSELAEEWYKRQKKLRLKNTTLKGYKSSMKYAVEFFGDMYVHKIKRIDVEDYIIHLMDKELNNKTINNKLIAVRRILELAYDREYIEENPSKRVKNLRVEKSEIEPFTAEEVSLILNYAYKHYHRFYAFYAVLFMTGMRMGEVLAMKWQNVDFNRGTYHVRERMTSGDLDTVKTVGSKRHVVLTDEVLQALKVHKKYSFMKSDFVFINQYGKPYDSSTAIREYAWEPMLKRLGLEYRIMYQARHTYAVLSLLADDNINFICSQLGHASFEMLFRVYGRFIKNNQAKPNISSLISLDHGNQNSTKIAQ
ncbi:tyrosine-type recombinase/integrase [Flexistipes sp.]|uniref:tyrosine-type recombinase/integrase n=1 Tax=Flexistipes sp. TaxID=3088135 RepID=UPI002E23D825|nr:tyrosine-type recombinase/integrase [Flexistipes sp.]